MTSRVPSHHWQIPLVNPLRRANWPPAAWQLTCYLRATPAQTEKVSGTSVAGRHCWT